MGKRTPTERIASLREKIAQKRTSVEDYNITLTNTQKKKDAANKAIEGYEKQIAALETDLLAKALHDKGINISDVAAAIEAGLFDNSVPEKPPDVSENQPEAADKLRALRKPTFPTTTLTRRSATCRSARTPYRISGITARISISTTIFSQRRLTNSRQAA